MEIEQKLENSVQLEELYIENVCRTCLCTSEESMISLSDLIEEDDEAMEKINFLDLINLTFSKIVRNIS
jgi:hypothetical protein